MKIFDRSLDYHFTLYSFKISQKSSDFAVKILIFLWRSGGFAPGASPPLIRKVLNYHLFSRGPTREFQEKSKDARGKFREDSYKFASLGGLRPRTPWSDKIFNYSYIFGQPRVKNSCNFCKVIKFYITDFGKFPEIFSTFGGLRPPNPPLQHVHIRLFIFPITKNLWPPKKLKKFLFFPIFINFNAYF